MSLKASEKVFGKRDKRKQWLSDDTWKNINERKYIKIRLNSTYTRSERLNNKLQTYYNNKNKEVKKGPKKDRKNYVESLAQETEEASKRGERSVVYKISRQLCRKTNNNDTPALSKDEELLTTGKDQLDRWAEHFSSILNCTATDRNAPDIQPL